MKQATRRWECSILVPLVMLALGLPGCGGGDKDKNPASPGPGGNQTFSQSEAMAQSQSAGLQAVALVQSVTALAGGFGKRMDGDYHWNEQEKRWEWNYLADQAGYNYNWFYTVQYVDSLGLPQQFPSRASSVNHAMTGTGTYHSQTGNTVLDYDFTYTYNVGIAGLGSQLFAMTGQGTWGIDYAYSSGGQSFSARYAVAWHALDDGITVPAGGGCPSGTIRYDFAPYHMNIVFNGTATAVATLFDGNGAPVAAGSRTYPLGCAAE